MDYFKLVTAVFAVSYVLVYKDGPFNLFENARYKIDAMNCLPCLSFWLSIPVAYWYGLLTALSIWGVVIALDIILWRLDS